MKAFDFVQILLAPSFRDFMGVSIQVQEKSTIFKSPVFYNSRHVPSLSKFDSSQTPLYLQSQKVRLTSSLENFPTIEIDYVTTSWFSLTLRLYKHLKNIEIGTSRSAAVYFGSSM